MPEDASQSLRELHWVIPNRAQRAALRQPIAWEFGVILYVATFLILAPVLWILTLILTLISPGRSAHDPLPLIAALYCANCIAIGYPLMWLFLYVVCPKEHVTLAPQGIKTVLGTQTRFFPYTGLRGVRVEPNRRMPSLYWLSFATMSGARREYSIDPAIDPHAIVEFLIAHGVAAEMTDSPSPRAHFSHV